MFWLRFFLIRSCFKMNKIDPSKLQFYIDTASISHKMVDVIKKELNQELRIHHVRYRHWLVLKALHFREANTPAKIAKMVCVEKSSLSRILDHLVIRSLIERNRDAVDRRIINLELTNKGQHVVNVGLKRLPIVNKIFKQILSRHEFDIMSCMEKEYSNIYK